MPDYSDALRVGVVADVSDLKAKMIEASGSVESASARMAAALKAQGLTSAEIAMGLDSVGLSAKGLVPATETASAGMSNFRNAMGAARVEMGAFEGSTGMMAGGLARVAAQSQALAPIISAAFPAFAVLAFADIISTVGEKVYKVAENFLFLQDQEDALTAITDKLRNSEISLTDSIGKSYVELAKLTEGPLAATRAALDSMQNRPVKLPFDEKDLKKFPDDIQQFVKGFQAITGADIAGALDTINAKIKQQESQLEMVNSDIAEAGEMGTVAYGRQAEQLQLNIQLLRQLGQAVVDQESKLRAETAVTAAEGAKQEQEAEDRAARQSERLARENAEGQRRLQEDLKKVKLPSNDADMFAAMGQSMPKMAADWQKGLNAILDAQIKTDTAIDVDVLKATNEEIAIHAKAHAKIVEENEKATEKMMHAWEKLSADINRPFTQAMDAVFRGTETASLAFRKMGSEIVMNVINTLTQATLKAIEFEAIAALIPGFGGGATMGSVFTGALGFERGGVVPMPSAAGGAVVPIMAHAGEMILPRDLSEGVQNAIRGGGLRGSSSGGGGGGGGDTHNYHFGPGAISVHANDAEGLAKQLQRMIRRGQFKFR